MREGSLSYESLSLSSKWVFCENFFINLLFKQNTFLHCTLFLFKLNLAFLGLAFEETCGL